MRLEVMPGRWHTNQATTSRMRMLTTTVMLMTVTPRRLHNKTELDTILIRESSVDLFAIKSRFLVSTFPDTCTVPSTFGARHIH